MGLVVETGAIPGSLGGGSWSWARLTTSVGYGGQETQEAQQQRLNAIPGSWEEEVLLALEAIGGG